MNTESLNDLLASDITLQKEYLSSIFACASDVPMHLVTGGKEILIQSLADLPINTSDLYAVAEGNYGVFFVAQYTSIHDEGGPTSNCTAELAKGDSRLKVYGFQYLQDGDDARHLIAELNLLPVDEPIPAPGVDGWSLLHSNPEVFVTPESLRAILSGALHIAEELSLKPEPVIDPVAENSAQKYGDAVMMTPYDETLYGQDFVITAGASAESRNWKPATMPLGAFIARICQHKVGTKDGPAFVLADMVPGQRLKTSVKSLTGIGLDIDTGMSTAAVDAAISKLTCVAVRYSTHSSGKTKTEFKKDKVMKFIVAHGAGKELEDDETIRWFLKESEEWDQAVIDTAVYKGTEHGNKGIMVVVEHMPMPKNRVVIPLKVPFDIASEGTLQSEAMKKWSKVPTALAALMGIPLDKTGTDPSRLFYFPRHAEGKAFSAAVWGGELFDWNTLTLDDAFEAFVEETTKGKSKSVTPEGRELGRWSIKRAHGFQIADVIEAHCPDKIRGNASQGFDVECPFDEDHSNAGDTEDRAFFVVNAGMGSSEVFTASCRHESCRDKTNLDMLGRMLKDQWFEKEVLESDEFNAILDEEELEKINPAAAKINKEDKAVASYRKAIDALAPESTSDEVEKVCITVAEADLSALERDDAIAKIAKRAARKIPIVSSTVKNAEGEIRKKRQSWKKGDSKGRALFTDSGDFPEACDFCTKVLLDKNKKDKLPTYSHLAGEPVRLTIKSNKVDFLELTEKGLKSELNTLASFLNEKGGGRRSVNKDISEYLFHQARAVLPPAPEVFYSPIYLKDGQLLETPGFVKQLNTLLVLGDLRIPAVPKRPTKSDVERAVHWIRTELFADFPFCALDSEGVEMRGPTEANAFAMLLTHPMRRMIGGRTPLFAVTKPVAGTGASQLAVTPMIIYDGPNSDTASLNYTPDEGEMVKVVVSALQQGRNAMFFDNVDEFNNPMLLRSITSGWVSGRVLGSSKIVDVPNTFHWVCTGNRIRMAKDMRRRTCWINLDAKLPDPEKRMFRHPGISGVPFEQFVTDNRGLAIHHILTMIEYWLIEGAPTQKDRRLTGFEDWSEKLGGLLNHCGVEGFLNTQAPVNLDLGQDAAQTFIASLFNRYQNSELSGKELFDLAVSTESELAEGRSIEEKRARFLSKLQRLVSQTFVVDKLTLTLKGYLDKKTGVMAYGLKPVTKIT